MNHEQPTFRPDPNKEDRQRIRQETGSRREVPGNPANGTYKRLTAAAFPGNDHARNRQPPTPQQTLTSSPGRQRQRPCRAAATGYLQELDPATPTNPEPAAIHPPTKPGTQEDPPPCHHPAHKKSRWVNKHGQAICTICHPPPNQSTRA